MRPESFSLNPYEVLGVSPNASNEEIQAAYRQHALRWHPDRNPNDEYSMRMMQRINAAWAILKDEHSRAAYDRWERGDANTASGPDAWEQPPSGPPPGGEWYRPPPPDNYAAHYNATNDSKTGQLAGFWIRLVASLIDVGIVIVIALFVASVLGIPIMEYSDPDGWNIATIMCIAWLLKVFYFTVSVTAWSTTLGKQIFGLRVVRTDGSKIRVCRAFARIISFFCTFSPILLVAGRKDKRGLHDLICDTKVVYR